MLSNQLEHPLSRRPAQLHTCDRPVPHSALVPVPQAHTTCSTAQAEGTSARAAP